MFETIANDTAEPAVQHAGMDAVHRVLWQSINHLFPEAAIASEPKPGWLTITWSLAGDRHAKSQFAAPILIKVERDLISTLAHCAPEQQRRIAHLQEPAVRAGMTGYNPYESVPNARVIVLG